MNKLHLCSVERLHEDLKTFCFFGTGTVWQKGRLQSSEGSWVSANTGSNPNCDGEKMQKLN